VEKMDGYSLNIVKENIGKLKEIFPEVFCEDKVDFERLQEVLGEYVEDKEERYRFEWHGKSKAIRIAQTPSRGTLRPCKEESKNWDTTENLYIEGDNLEVLKLLQKSYQNKIKMIYIDPPYNTGNDFVYKDDYKDNLKNYLEITGQVDKEGNKISTNSETSGRYHTNWLNMMYPRLRLAKNLLSEDGVIFISIDENEYVNLKKICDDIFGESNGFQTLIWKKKYTGGKHSKTFADYHEYIVGYCKNIDSIGEILMDRPENEKGKFEYEDEYSIERGKYYIRPLKSNLDPRPTLVYPITLPDGTSITTQWIVAKDTFDSMLHEGRILFKMKKDGNYQVYKKYYEKDGGGKVKIPSIIEFVSNNDAKEELKNILDIKQTRDLPFQTPKPIKLLEFLIDNFSDKDNIVLDFFSGSSSTAHAVIESNLSNNKNIKFIMVQLPKSTDISSETYKNICEIGKERIRRAGDKIVSENKDKEGIEDLDIGFKVFKLDSSNIKPWNPSYEDIAHRLDEMVDNFVPGRTEEDVVYEIMLKYGIDLTYPIEVREISGKKVFSIGFGALIICLDNEITLDVVNGIVDLKNELNPETTRIVFKDNGFKTDSVKTNAIEILKRNNINENEIMSI
jgi:adenine-specific DNA-methyltransferase